VILVDDGLYQCVDHSREVRESRVREKHGRRLMLLADNIAYYT